MKMLVAGEWTAGESQIEVCSPFSGEAVDTVPRAGAGDIARALDAAAEGAREMAGMPAHARAAILRRAADLCEARAESLAQTLVAEVGKPITEARGEAGRAAEMFRLAAFEGAHLRGETLQLDALAVPPAEDKMGMTLRMPCGIVAAITPFNFPSLLVVHKIAPALATGNAVILKPATATPLSGLASGGNPFGGGRAAECDAVFDREAAGRSAPPCARIRGCERFRSPAASRSASKSRARPESRNLRWSSAQTPPALF